MGDIVSLNEMQQQSITDRTRVMIEEMLGGKMKPKTRRQYCAAMKVFLACFEISDGVITHAGFEAVNKEQGK